MYLGSWKIDDLVTFTADTHDPTTGEETDADADPTYRIYEDETGVAILSGTMSTLDGTNTIGQYSEQITLSAANGFEKGKSYNIRIRGVVGGVAGVTKRFLQIEAEVDAHRLNWANIDNPTTAQNLSGTNIDVDQVVASVSGAVGSVTGNVGGNVVGTVASVVGNVGGNVVGTVASVVGAVGSVTGNVGGNVVGSVGSINGSTFESLNLDHLMKIAVDTNFATTVHSDSVIGQLAHDGIGTGGNFDRTTDSLEAIRNRGDVAWITATGFSTHSAADVWAVATRTLTAATNISGPIADQVWEEAIADHSGTAGSTAEALNAAGSAGDPWTTSLPGSYTGTQAGKILADILVDTAEIGTAGAGLTNINLPNQTMDIIGNITGNLSGSVGSVTGNIDGNVTGSVGSIAGTTFESIHLDHLFASADPGGVVANSSFWAKLHSKSATPAYSSYANTTDSLEALRDRGDTAWITGTTPPTANEIRDNILGDSTSWISGTVGFSINETYLATVASLNHSNSVLRTRIDTKASQSSVDDIPTNAELAAAIITGLTTALTEGYRAAGATGSVRDLLYEILNNIADFSITGTTKTTRKINGTAAKTYTLDAIPPTGITETT